VSGTNRVRTIATPTGTRTIAHDARGNQTSEQWPGGLTVTVAYDGHARLTLYRARTATTSATQAMLYSGEDERVRVVTTPATGAADTRLYVYDTDHRIIGEYGAGGTADIKAEYIWLSPEVGASGPAGGDDGLGGWMPLATAVGQSGALHWLHTHHNGAPILTTNATGTVVPHPGHAVLGFPGQFANAQGLAGAQHYYNRHRDYDPSTGRYIQADPIGLAGDDNPYSYARNNALRFTDPTGEVAWLVPVVAGVALGVGLDLATQAAENWFTGKSPLDPGNYNVGRAAISGAFGGVTGGAGAFWSGSMKLGGAGLLSGGTGAQVAQTSIICTEGVYHFLATSGKIYVGQSGNIAQRLAQHVAEGKLLAKELSNVVSFKVAGGKTAREVAEQRKINELGGIGNLQNKRNPIGLKRKYLVPEDSRWSP
jgi:RHS repeat-associated protein